MMKLLAPYQLIQWFYIQVQFYIVVICYFLAFTSSFAFVCEKYNYHDF